MTLSGHGSGDHAIATRELNSTPVGTVLVASMPGARTVVVDVFVPAGPAFETAANNGISHFLEHAVLAGTRSHPERSSLQAAIDSTGGFLDALTYKEMTQFSFQILPEQLEAALALLGESLARPTLSQAVVESERAIVLEEMATGAWEGAKDPFSEILWGTSSVGLPIIGTRAVVSGITGAQLRDCWTRCYTASAMVMAVAGRVDIAALERGLGSFADLPQGPPPTRGRGPIPRTDPAIRIEREASDAVDLCLMFRTRGWSESSASYHAAVSLLAQFLQLSFYQRLVGPGSPVYYLYSGQETFVPEGYLYVYFKVSSDRFETTLDRVLAEVSELRERGIPTDALELCKRRARLGVLGDQEDPRAVAFRLGADRLRSGRDGAISLSGELEALAAVTASDLQTVIAELFRPSQFGVVSRGDLGWWGRRRLRKRLERFIG